MRPSAYHDDSTGKNKIDRHRSTALSLFFFLGVCIGVVVSERLYVQSVESQTHQGRRVMRTSDGTTKHHLGGGLGTLFTQQQQQTQSNNNELQSLLEDVAPGGEVMIVISNANLLKTTALLMWLDCARRLPSLTNWLVVAIDEELRDYCVQNNINHYYRPVVIPDSQKDTGDNHAVSAMKFEIIEEFLALGWNVLLSDVDVVIVQDPFQYLYRDSDVEGMTDGYDDGTAYGEMYGVDDPSMGWSRYAQGSRHMALNSGLFYLTAGAKTIQLMKRIAQRVRTEKVWDQSVYNEELFFLSHGDYKSTQCSVRVMDREKFMNSKYLFKTVRKIHGGKKPPPVMVHVNYHPDKEDRMRAVIGYYLDGDEKALDPFPGGSEPGT